MYINNNKSLLDGITRSTRTLIHSFLFWSKLSPSLTAQDISQVEAPDTTLKCEILIRNSNSPIFTPQFKSTHDNRSV